MLTKRERTFLENFLMTKIKNKFIDNLNFEHDLNLYDYPHKSELRKLFFKFYDKPLSEIEKIKVSD